MKFITPITMPGSSIDPSYKFIDVIPSDTEFLTYLDVNGKVNFWKTKAIYIGTAGDLTVTNDANVPVTYVGLLAGTLLVVSTQQIMATGTSAGSLIVQF